MRSANDANLGAFYSPLKLPAAADRWTAEAEAKEPDAPCRRLNSIYAMHAILVEVPVKPDGYGSLHELAMPQARLHSAKLLNSSYQVLSRSLK